MCYIFSCCCCCCCCFSVPLITLYNFLVHHSAAAAAACCCCCSVSDATFPPNFCSCTLPLLQISVGTGVKAGVNVWQAMHNIKEAHSVWDHLKGVPVREADLVLPLQLVSSVDDHAEVAKLLAEGRQLKQMPAVQLKQMPTAAVQLKEVPAEMGEWKDTDMARDNIV
eukprot:GHUV01043490.1.p1 GENE.GHUV01043490.1~~GHUV01043490.1.p1  ORF type:complete len:167 (+),score=62.86 GHUV01043490.1:71-571(+)